MDKATPEHRYRFIELISFWEGAINTRRITEQFGLSRQQASSDINSYRQALPENLHYDPSKKSYQPTATFERRYISDDVFEYLNWLQGGYRLPMSSPLPNVALHLPARHVSPHVMRGLVTAIRTQQRLEVDYVSLSNPNRQGRIIVPHTFVSTGLRWHLRAWCEKSQSYRDFVLSRFRGEPELLGKSTHTAGQDTAWNTNVTLIFQPDPRLSPEKQNVIAHDYQMHNGQLRITTKGCLVQYLLQEMQVNTKILDGIPEAQQLVLVNLDDVKEWFF